MLYVGSFVVLTYPLIFHFNSGIVGFTYSDAPLFLWNVWDLKESISAGQNPFETHRILFPHTNSLLLHTHTTVQSVGVLVVHLFLQNIVLSFNIVFLVSAVLGAYSAYYFLNLVTHSTEAAIIGGQFFGFQHLWAVYTFHGTQNVLSFWYIPLCLVTYELYRKKERLFYLIICGSIAGLAVWNDFIMGCFAIVSLTLYLVGTNILQKKSLKKFVKEALIIGISFLLITSGKWLTVITSRSYISSIPLPTTEDLDVYHADIVNLFRPSAYHLLWGRLHTLFTPHSLTQGNNFIGFTSIGLFILFLITVVYKKQFVSKKQTFLFLGIYTVLLLIAFGPFLHVFGYHTYLPMPFYVIGKLYEPLRNLRVPLRWLIPAQLFLAGAFVCILKHILNHMHNKIKILLCCLLYIGLVIDSSMIPKSILPVYDSSPVYTKIANDEYGSVLEFPFGISSGYYTIGSDSKINMLHQLVHQKPIIGGHMSRLPFEYRDWYSKEPVLKYFLNYKEQSPDDEDKQVQNIAQFIKTYKLTYIIFDKRLDSFDDPAAFVLKKFIHEDLKFQSYYEDQSVIAFKKQ